MSDSFLNFLTKEIRPFILGRYNLSGEPSSTAIMGASLGGLISTYAAFRHYRTFGLAAAQSPSYWWKDEALIDSIVTSRRRPFRLYMDTGTIRDALQACRRMASALVEKGYDFIYNEYPEAHNWANWRARIADILTYFFPKAQ